MVLSRSAASLMPALVVPDEQTWSVWGVDPARLDAEPVFEPAAVRRLLLPERLPEALAEPLANWLAGVPPDAVPDERRLPFPGTLEIDRLSVRDELERNHHQSEGHDAHGSHGGHGGHDHGDMMAIVGEPSADGLVMEPIELRFGPLGTPFPAGLATDVTLDGDVVAECSVTALLTADESIPGPPDRLAPKAWELAVRVARERAEGVSAPPRERWTRIAALELERAVSHTAWLRSLARVLAWPELIERCVRALAVIDAARPLGRAALTDARRELEALAAFVRGSRRLRWRTAGRGRIPSQQARHLGLRGPVARASGVPDDARADDPLYRRLGFEPVVDAHGDALARTVVRAAEAAASAELAARAVHVATDSAHADALPGSGLAVVEGPRGPLQVAPDGSDRSARGEASAREAAAAAAVGTEWAAALVILASFDLSPWRVGS